MNRDQAKYMGWLYKNLMRQHNHPAPTPDASNAGWLNFWLDDGEWRLLAAYLKQRDGYYLIELPECDPIEIHFYRDTHAERITKMVVVGTKEGWIRERDEEIVQHGGTTSIVIGYARVSYWEKKYPTTEGIKKSDQ